MKFDFETFALHVRINLADPCRYKGKSLRELEPIFGISHPTISRAIKGKKLEIDTIIRLCHFLDLDITDYIINPTPLNS